MLPPPPCNQKLLHQLRAEGRRGRRGEKEKRERGECKAGWVSEQVKGRRVWGAGEGLCRGGRFKGRSPRRSKTVGIGELRRDELRTELGV